MIRKSGHQIPQKTRPGCQFLNPNWCQFWVPDLVPPWMDKWHILKGLVPFLGTDFGSKNGPTFCPHFLPEGTPKVRTKRFDMLRRGSHWDNHDPHAQVCNAQGFFKAVLITISMGFQICAARLGSSERKNDRDRGDAALFCCIVKCLFVIGRLNKRSFARTPSTKRFDLFEASFRTKMCA